MGDKKKKKKKVLLLVLVLIVVLLLVFLVTTQFKAGEKPKIEATKSDTLQKEFEERKQVAVERLRGLTKLVKKKIISDQLNSGIISLESAETMPEAVYSLSQTSASLEDLDDIDGDDAADDVNNINIFLSDVIRCSTNVVPIEFDGNETNTVGKIEDMDNQTCWKNFLLEDQVYIFHVRKELTIYKNLVGSEAFEDGDEVILGNPENGTTGTNAFYLREFFYNDWNKNGIYEHDIDYPGVRTAEDIGVVPPYYNLNPSYTSPDDIINVFDQGTDSTAPIRFIWLNETNQTTRCGDKIVQKPNDEGKGGPKNDGFEACDAGDPNDPGNTINQPNADCNGLLCSNHCTCFGGAGGGGGDGGGSGGGGDGGVAVGGSTEGYGLGISEGGILIGPCKEIIKRPVTGSSWKWKLTQSERERSGETHLQILLKELNKVEDSYEGPTGAVSWYEDDAEYMKKECSELKESLLNSLRLLLKVIYEGEGPYYFDAIKGIRSLIIKQYSFFLTYCGNTEHWNIDENNDGISDILIDIGNEINKKTQIPFVLAKFEEDSGKNKQTLVWLSGQVPSKLTVSDGGKIADIAPNGNVFVLPETPSFSVAVTGDRFNQEISTPQGILSLVGLDSKTNKKNILNSLTTVLKDTEVCTSKKIETTDKTNKMKTGKCGDLVATTQEITKVSDGLPPICEKGGCFNPTKGKNDNLACGQKVECSVEGGVEERECQGTKELAISTSMSETLSDTGAVQTKPDGTPFVTPDTLAQAQQVSPGGLEGGDLPA